MTPTLTHTHTHTHTHTTLMLRPGWRWTARAGSSMMGRRDTQMSITVEFDPEIEERLRIQAAARGVPVQDYIQDLIRRSAVGAPGDRPSLGEFDADWAAFADGLDHLAPLPPDA